MKRKSESLIQQCERLNIDYIEIKLDYEGKPEIALLEYFKNQGSIGTTSEGGAILTFMKACFLDKLSELNSFGCKDDACNRYLEAQFEILKDFKDVIINSIDSLSKETFIRVLA
ncbi:hypothetical protein [Acinetobacter sp. ASP199]|uniref:hypothetical protein n=1 Tax=unclassified Acinetobacter TaxID=196816 RepID=UPI001F624CE7|nr:hypothetical protein [Acinetobacter sp. ASP199]UNT59241.1 hypothetical protein IHE35_14440 [Acinetobacter sp. ASP199]